MSDQTTVQDPAAAPASAPTPAAEAAVVEQQAMAAPVAPPLPGDWQRALAALDRTDTNPLANYLDPTIKRPLWDLALIFAGSQWVPKHFQGKQADCFIGIHFAGRLRVDPLTVLQSAYVVHGRPSLEAKFLIQLANERGPFVGGIRYRKSGTVPLPGKSPADDFAVTAYAAYPDGEVAEATVSIAMARAEGWAERNPKYTTMPEQMLCYRAACMLIRRCCPGVSMGVLSREELEESPEDRGVITPVARAGAVAAEAATQSVKDRIAALSGKEKAADATVEAVPPAEPPKAEPVAEPAQIVDPKKPPTLKQRQRLAAVSRAWMEATESSEEDGRELVRSITGFASSDTSTLTGVQLDELMAKMEAETAAAKAQK